MKYEIAKIFNNNAILGQEPDGKQVVLIGKGVGFGVRRGDLVDGDDSNNKVFSVLEDGVSPGSLKRFDYDVVKIERVAQEIVEIAKRRLEIVNDGLYDALYDHIAFAIQRLKIGLPIDNPFIGEISVMCAKEYEVAQLAAELIREKIDVDIGEPEKGFIALHLYSARRNKHINTAIKSARFYKQALTLVGLYTGQALDAHLPASKSFLIILDRLVRSCLKEKPLNMPVRRFVQLNMSEDMRCANKISELMEKEFGAGLTSDAKAYLAVMICLLTQLLSSGKENRNTSS